MAFFMVFVPVVLIFTAYSNGAFKHKLMQEFSLIQQYFARYALARDDVLLGIGDDAAVCQVPTGQALVTSVDTLVAGVHFPLDTAPEDIAYKALAVNLSDLAAMGATPAWFTLALTLPTVDKTWLAAFSQGLLHMAQAHQVALIGGDTTRGALTISVQIMGFCPPQQVLKRRGARPGDKIYVTGWLGDAGLALRYWQGDIDLSEAQAAQVLPRLQRPTPRLAAGQALRGLASSAIDVSDGLLADLGHLLAGDKLGAELRLETLPLSSVLRDLPRELAWALALSAGDDYELCFTLPVAQSAQVSQNLALVKSIFTCIGTVTDKSGIVCLDEYERIYTAPQKSGYQHF